MPKLTFQSPFPKINNIFLLVDAPFFQKETDSSYGEQSKDSDPSAYHILHPGILKTLATTSSIEDYRSVIDDLTVEIKRLKVQLKKYKKTVPESLKKDALFEVRVHRLSKRKKRELESTLREFAISLRGTSTSGASSNNLVTSSGRGERPTDSLVTGSKDTSSRRRLPEDSAYASMSNTGRAVSGMPVDASNSSLLVASRPGLRGKARTAEQKVQSYLDGVPEGLYPRQIVLSEKDKQKVVVKRLEMLFTGRSGRPGQLEVDEGNLSKAPILPSDSTRAKSLINFQPPNSRQAPMLKPDAVFHKKGNLREQAGSTSASAYDPTESGAITSRSGNVNCENLPSSGSGSGNGNGNGPGSGSGIGNRSTRSSKRGAQPSPAMHIITDDQRATLLSELDPDRIQPPAENLEYMRHLGLAPPPDLSQTVYSSEDVAPDADGWVWLNLLCNMAQLHILNVTPSFIRKSVVNRSTKFQISPCGQKIRWRGGTEGTQFSSDSSGQNSGQSRSTDEEASADSGSSTQPKKKKIQNPTLSGGTISGEGSSNSRNLRVSSRLHHSSSSNFHYKPMFVRQGSSTEQTSDECVSLDVNSNGNSFSRWGSSGLGGSPGTHGRRVDGSIVYYDGAPFCTDLSRNPPTTVSPTPSSVINTDSISPFSRPANERTSSGSLLPYRPLSDRTLLAQPPASPDLMDIDKKDYGSFFDINHDNSSENGGNDSDLFEWHCVPSHPMRPRVEQLTASGLGGVTPGDNFLVLVETRRPKLGGNRSEGFGALHASKHQQPIEDATETIISRIANMSTSPTRPHLRVSLPLEHQAEATVDVQYLSSQTRVLEPSPLPPPATYQPPFSSDESNDTMMDLDYSEDADESSELVQLPDNDREELLSRLANPHLSPNTSDDDETLSSGDEEDEVDPDTEAGYDASNNSDPNVQTRETGFSRAGSLAATVGEGADTQLSSTEGADEAIDMS